MSEARGSSSQSPPSDRLASSPPLAGTLSHSYSTFTFLGGELEGEGKSTASWDLMFLFSVNVKGEREALPHPSAPQHPDPFT